MKTTNLTARQRKAYLFRLICTAISWMGIGLLAILIFHVTSKGISWLDWQFLTDFPSRFPERAGIKSALVGTIWFISMTACFSIPLGTAAAIYLEEYSSKGPLGYLIEVNIANLAGVPSIVYGLLGLVIFVRGMELGRSLLAGSLTMTLLILPIIIIAAREAIRAVPNSIRLAAFALGATRWQMLRFHVLPQALPGILTGVILALSRAIGETAPLIMIGALTYVAFVPEGPLDAFTVLPIQIFNWASRPQEDFHHIAATGIIVLLAVLFFMNIIAVLIRHHAEKKGKV